MTGRTLMLFVVAVLMAVMTVMIIKNHTQSQQGQTGGPKILVATSDIPAGSFVHADRQLAWVEWSSTISPSFIRPEGHRIEEFNGAIARRGIVAGEPVTTTSIVRANEGGFMSAVLTPGKRAVSIAVNSTSGNAGFIFPGDHVDLILTHKVPGGTLASQTFVEDVRVLAIDQMLDNPENKAMVAKTITLEVNPKQVEMVNVAASLGSISVSLRSLAKDAQSHPAIDSDIPRAPGDNYSTDADVSKLMDDKSNPRGKVNVYHGNTTEQIDFHQVHK